MAEREMSVWKDRIGMQFATPPWVDELDPETLRVRADLSRGVHDVYGAPPFATLVIEDVRTSLTIGGEGRDSPGEVILIVTATEPIEIAFQFKSYPVPTVQINADGIHPRDVTLRGERKSAQQRTVAVTEPGFPPGLTLAGGTFHLDGVPDLLLSLEAADIQLAESSSERRVQQLTLRGSNQIRGQLSADRLNLDGRSGPIEVIAPGNIEFVEVLNPDDPTAPIEISLTCENVAIFRIPPRSRLILDGRVQLGSSPRGGTIDELEIHGDGTIAVYCELDGLRINPEFNEPARAPLMTIELYGRLVDPLGIVSLAAFPGGSCIGNPGQLRLRRLERAEDAEIEDVSLYDLESIQDLNTLATASLINPWFPRPKDARILEDKMLLGGGTPKAIRRKRAYFWSKLSEILRDKHASGSAQSDARYAAARARYLSLNWGREKCLLWLYRLIGFGERIAWPLFWLFGLAAVAALIHVRNTVWNGPFRLIKLTAAYFLSPLTFFRISDLPGQIEVTTFGPQLLLLGLKTFGVVLIGFALLATRRLATPERI